MPLKICKILKKKIKTIKKMQHKKYKTHLNKENN